MTYGRPDHARQSAASHTLTTRQVVRFGAWKFPISVTALGLSVIIHTGLFTAAYYTAWRPGNVTPPQLNFAKGDQAARIQVRLVPWSDPAKEEMSVQEPQEHTPVVESSAIARNDEKMEVEPVPEDVETESMLDPPVVVTKNQDMPTEKKPDAAEVAEVAETAEVTVTPVLEDAHEVVPTDDNVEVVDLPKPVETVPVKEAPTPPTTETMPSKASSSQTVGVKTGIEMLNLPAPKYPSLSRRKGEEGLVLLQVEVLPDGTVGLITVLQDAGYRRLVDAAIVAARKGRFKPATQDGHPISDTVRIPFQFVIQ